MAEIEKDLELVRNLYMRLEALVELERKPGGRKLPWKSKLPLNLEVVDHMAQLERFLADWIKHARWILEPWSRVDITDRVKAVCPYCSGKLVGWLHSGTETSYVQCVSDELHAEGEPKQWFEHEWHRLGVLSRTIRVENEQYV